MTCKTEYELHIRGHLSVMEMRLLIWDNKPIIFTKGWCKTINRLFTSITLTEIQKNTFFAFGEKDKIDIRANLIIAACMCEVELTKTILINLADSIESVGIKMKNLSGSSTGFGLR